MELLKFENISKVFGKKELQNQVLSNISSSIKSQQFVTLLGPSGCGKTTLLNIIGGFLKPDAGQVILEGKRVTGPGPERGFVFQNYALFPWMTVKDNILFPMKRQKMPAPQREDRVQELLSMANLEGKEHLYPHQLSGGMKQRTAVIRSIAYRPQVLLMDEPLGAVDFQMRQTLQEELESIFIRDKVTVMMVTHDVEEAVYMSDRVIVMSNHQGAIAEDYLLDLKRPRDRRSTAYRQAVNHLMDTLQISSNGSESVADLPRVPVLQAINGGCHVAR
ncbi:MAG: ABC transporter ATP-binding protein [Firmicutes bacterium HGW-Firmicutes-15]|nr:MAG: ABC transporter ATP-binding protein [Firmicutes bacterium HGW-Firmicutes-15]